MNSSNFIPFNRASIGEEEIAEVVATLRSGWLTTGPRTLQFEREFKEYVSARFALAVNSCTAGLHLALAALGIGPGDEVITTPLTFCATVNSVLHVGATPVLADVGPDGNLDPAAVSHAITAKTRAIIPVHLAGLPCDMLSLWRIASEHGLAVVEDAAHATGTRYRGSPVGGPHRASGFASDAVAFSFYATKNLTTGEGGMVTTEREDLIDRMKVLCLHGISKDAWNRYAANGSWFYRVVECGFKYNLSDIQSAIGIHQLRRQEGFIRVRRRYAELYSSLFADVEEVEPPPAGEDCRHCWHLYILRLNLSRLSIDRDEFIRALHDRGIGASVHFIPIDLHPYFSGRPDFVPGRCPMAAELYRRVLSLPLYPAMTEEQVRRVAAAVREIARANRSAPVAA